MGSIVVPLDESELAEEALPWAAYLARALGCGVRLVTVAERPPESLARPGAGGSIGSRSREYLETMAQRQLFAGVTVDIEVHWGSAIAELRSALDSPDVKLAVLTSRGRGGIERAVRGSTADALVRTGARPIVVVSSGSPLPPLSSVVVALDGSSAAAKALAYARELGRAVGAALHLVRVFDPLSQMGLAWPVDGMESVRDELKRRATHYLAGIKYSDEEAVVLEGDAAEAVLGYAEGRSAGMVVVGTRGRGGLFRFALGSTADAIMRKARRPVMIVR